MLSQIPETLIIPLIVFAVLLASLLGGVFRTLMVLFMSYRLARWALPIIAGAGMTQAWYVF
jgi:hypothetical protein